MMGLEQIKTANRNPRKHAQSELSDGQLRRNNAAQPSAYWSEKPVLKTPPRKRKLRQSAA